MNEKKFHKNVDDIELKCNELITEINDHLSIYCEPQWNADNDQQRINHRQKSIQDTNTFVTTCHNKSINLALNCTYIATKSDRRENLNVAKILIPKNTCCNVTKINQLIIPGDSTAMSLEPDNGFVDELGLNLQIQHLNHINIKPALTKQSAFIISCRDERNFDESNVATFNFIHNNADTNSKYEEHSNVKDVQSEAVNEIHEIHEIRRFLFGNTQKISSNSVGKKNNSKPFQKKRSSKRKLQKVDFSDGN